MMELDIFSGGEYPADALSNFTARAFTIDGVVCGSMEGFLQSLKFIFPQKQRKVCALTGKRAKRCGKNKFLWKWTQTVHWQGKRIARNGPQFTALILRAYQEMYQADATFRKALEDAKGYTLRHSIGKQDKRRTILTEKEFLFCLQYLQTNGAGKS